MSIRSWVSRVHHLPLQARKIPVATNLSSSSSSEIVMCCISYERFSLKFSSRPQSRKSRQIQLWRCHLTWNLPVLGQEAHHISATNPPQTALPDCFKWFLLLGQLRRESVSHQYRLFLGCCSRVVLRFQEFQALLDNRWFAFRATASAWVPERFRCWLSIWQK